MGEAVTIGTNKYQVGVMPARVQFHVARRLAPMLAPIAAQVKDGKFAADNLMDALGPMAEVLAGMPDKDVDFILDACLGCCQMHNERHNVWGPVTAPNGRLMDETVKMPELLQLAWRVIEENLGNFFAELPRPSPEEGAPA